MDASGLYAGEERVLETYLLCGGSFSLEQLATSRDRNAR